MKTTKEPSKNPYAQGDDPRFLATIKADVWWAQSKANRSVKRKAGK